jgi:hypothetical protein
VVYFKLLAALLSKEYIKINKKWGESLAILPQVGPLYQPQFVFGTVASSDLIVTAADDRSVGSIGGGGLKSLERNVSQWNFPHPKSHMNCPRIEPWTL